VSRGDEPNEMGDALPPVDLGKGRTAKFVAMGSGATCAILDNDSAKCWGPSGASWIGYGRYKVRTMAELEMPMGDRLRPLRFAPGKVAKAIAIGTAHACALFDDGTVTCWGDARAGQLGFLPPTNDCAEDDFDIEHESIQMCVAKPPTHSLPLGEKVADLKAGADFNCALLESGKVKCWGANDSGQLGTGTAQRTWFEKPAKKGAEKQWTIPDTSTNLGEGRKAVDIAVSGSHACALLDDGCLKCWGYGAEYFHGKTESLGAPPNECVEM
jgi:E3 ubiquitin-protein ligase HERC3